MSARGRTAALNLRRLRPILWDVESTLSAERLRAVIETQNEIAASALDLAAVMRLVCSRAQSLTGASASMVELAEGSEMVPHEANGSAVGARSIVCVPLIHRDRVVGVLKVCDPQPDAFGPADIETLELLSGVIAAHMSHAGEFQRQQQESRIDPLTGIGNRRAFDERLKGELARSRRHGGELSVCVFDLDRSEEMDDVGPHAAADEVLRGVARCLKRVRDEDGAFCIGGDQFALVLVGAGLPEAERVGVRVAEAVAAERACGGVGMSYGAASLLADDDVAGLLARADARMYAARRPDLDGGATTAR